MLKFKEFDSCQVSPNRKNDKIEITKSVTADSRTCDFSKVSKDELQLSSATHIDDVRKGLRYFSNRLLDAGEKHDFDKLTDIDGFYDNFITNFEKDDWYKRHVKVNRHHFNSEGGMPKDINLVDVIEMVVDCVMAGMARSGEVYDIKVKNDVLQTALKNTVDEIKKKILVKE